jgi:hypothetical protein
MHFDFDVIEVVDQILLVGDPLQEGCSIVLHPSSLLAPHPPVAMTEMKVSRENRIRKCHVTADDSRFNLLLKSQHLSGISARLAHRGLGEKRKGSEAKKAADGPSMHG